MFTAMTRIRPSPGLALHILQYGDFLETVTAPTRPEGDHHHLALETEQVHRVAFRVDADISRRHFTDLGCRLGSTGQQNGQPEHALPDQLPTHGAAQARHDGLCIPVH